MTKTHVQQFRITEVLKKRYEAALRANGVSATDHLTIEVLKFVDAHEKKQKKIASNK